MARILGGDIMDYLRPQGGWYMVGDDYEGITFVDCEPVTKAEFDKALADFPKLLAEKEAQAVTDKRNAMAKLEELGLTADDLKALGL